MEKNGDSSRLLRMIKIALGRRFNLHLGKADEHEVVASIKWNADFVGANLWTLIFAIFMASIGLNVNSTAVIIGAMLISPLMGPIMGIGLGIGINDFALVKKGGRNLLIATCISIAVSSLYFSLTPLHDAQSELLARTTPSLWDVFIAFLGGLAGIVAGTRKEKSNVIPGVAIATALMPPLCTAGFGLATGNVYYFFGALYLYFINSVFICISTFIIVRVLKFKKIHFDDKRYEKQVARYIFIIVSLTTLPSVYLAYRIVQKSIFENNAKRFVNDQFQFKNTQVINKAYKYSNSSKEIDLLLIGYELPAKLIDSINRNKHNYGLDSVRLIVRQGLNAKQEIDFAQIKASILEDVFKKDSAAIDNNELKSERQLRDIRSELKVLYPDITYYSVSNTVLQRTDTLAADSVTLVFANFRRRVSNTEKIKLAAWLKARLASDSLKLVVE